MAIEHGMNGAFGGNPDIACQPPEQELADLACAPMRLFPFEGDNQALDLLGQLVGITHWPPRAIAESLTTMLPVAVENLVAGFTRYPELPAHIRHRLPIQQPGDKAKAFFHHRTLFPRHPHLRLRKKPGSVTHVSDVSPISQAAHNNLKHILTFWLVIQTTAMACGPLADPIGIEFNS